ncbi:hypothetical protein EYF80_025478 [Liparis tanakae]|uniref:Uncharacterized protein n=1 Tax=Liparis tanakae TaxID=230148 RepID=A0A4Z2HEQ0_9TELE|nr:hypothetical protein EYF80_025478 [Liparis tanakae]
MDARRVEESPRRRGPMLRSLLAALRLLAARLRERRRAAGGAATRSRGGAPAPGASRSAAQYVETGRREQSAASISALSPIRDGPRRAISLAPRPGALQQTESGVASR